MADKTFEMEVDRMFGDSPIFPDADRFAGQVLARLDRGWSFRQVLIGGLGLAGGLIGGAQILGSGLAGRLNTLGAQSDALLSSRVAEIAVARFLPTGLPVESEMLWMSAALAILAVGFAVTRVIRDI